MPLCDLASKLLYLGFQGKYHFARGMYVIMFIFGFHFLLSFNNENFLFFICDNSKNDDNLIEYDCLYL